MRPIARQRRGAYKPAPSSPRLSKKADRNLRSPMYAQVYSSLREWINEGFYAPGSQLPPESELCEVFGVSRITTRQAIELLVDERLVIRQQGRGTFVAADIASAPVRSDMEQLLRKVKRLGTSTRVRDATVEEAVADEETCRDLELARGTEVVVASHVRLFRDEPIGFIVTYIPKDLRLNFKPRDFNRNPMLTLLERKGVSIAGADQFIGATLADTRLARLLETDIGAALVSVRLIVVDTNRRRVERLLAYYRADHYTHHAWLSRART